MKTLEKSGQMVKCLIIDDDRIDAEAVKRLLKKAQIGNPITHVTDAYQALKTLHNWQEDGSYPPILLFLDIRMPRMSGVELMGRLANEPFAPQLNVLVVTTSRLQQDQEALEQYNILGTINKKDLSSSFYNVLEKLGQHFDVKAA
jgi:CheY-like chemotaxis protein